MPLKRKSLTFSGILMTLFLAGFVIAGTRFLGMNLSGGTSISLEKLENNEVRAYEHLKQIRPAQEAYLGKSPALTGQASYAIFLTHLWTAVDSSGRPVKLDLIPESLAIAIGPSKAIDGYYFLDVRKRHDHKTRQPRKVDYGSSWAIAAIPRLSGQTGRLVFLIDKTGDIFAVPAKHYSSRFPLDPERAGWIPLPTLTELNAWQAESKASF